MDQVRPGNHLEVMRLLIMKPNLFVQPPEKGRRKYSSGNSPRLRSISKKPVAIAWLWWVAIAGLLAWNVWSFWPRGQVSQEIPFSTFLDQVRTNNVSQVTIKGSQIDGSLFRTFLIPNSGGEGRQEAVRTAAIISANTFTTHVPTFADKNDLVRMLDGHNVTITVIPAPTAWQTLIHSGFLPLTLLGLAFAGMVLWTVRRKHGEDALNIRGTFQPSIEHPEITLADVALPEEVLTLAQGWVKALNGSKSSQGLEPAPVLRICVAGKPGTGKTLLAKGVAGETNVPLLHLSAMAIDPSSAWSMAAEYVRKYAPCVALIEDHSSIGVSTAIQILRTDLERTPLSTPVLLIAETQAPVYGNLARDTFDQVITLNGLDRKGRENVLRLHTRSLNLAVNVNLGMIARTTTGFTGADLARLCTEAAGAARKNNHTQVTMPDFEEAFDQILRTVGPQPMLNEHERRAVAYHQCGHAMVAWRVPEANPQLKISLLACDQSDDIQHAENNQEHMVLRKSQLMAELSVLMGGRAAEEIGVEEYSTNVENDLRQATWLARRMVTRWGMGSFGPVALESDRETLNQTGIDRDPAYSQETLLRIDREVQDLLNERYTVARNILTADRDRLEKLVETLLVDETIDRTVINRILGSRPVGSPADTYPTIDIVDLSNRSTIA